MSDLGLLFGAANPAFHRRVGKDFHILKTKSDR